MLYLYEHTYLHNAQTLQSNQLHWWYLSIFLGERVILYRAISVKEIKSSLFTDITVTPVSCTIIFVIFCQYLVCACKINKKTQTYNTFATILQQKPAK